MTYRYSDTAFLEALERGGEEWVSTEEVADRVGCTMQTANHRLRSLAYRDDGPPIQVSDPEGSPAGIVAAEALPGSTRRSLAFRLTLGTAREERTDRDAEPTPDPSATAGADTPAVADGGANGHVGAYSDDDDD